MTGALSLHCMVYQDIFCSRSGSEAIMHFHMLCFYFTDNNFVPSHPVNPYSARSDLKENIINIWRCVTGGFGSMPSEHSDQQSAQRLPCPPIKAKVAYPLNAYPFNEDWSDFV